MFAGEWCQLFSINDFSSRSAMPRADRCSRVVALSLCFVGKREGIQVSKFPLTEKRKHKRRVLTVRYPAQRTRTELPCQPPECHATGFPKVTGPPEEACRYGFRFHHSGLHFACRLPNRKLPGSRRRRARHSWRS